MQEIQWIELFTAADHFLKQAAAQNAWLVYAILFGIFFSETGLVFMAFLPGDSLLFVAGALAGAGQLNVWLLMVLITVAAILGNSVNYMIGHWLGDKVYDGSIRWLDKEALERTHAFYEKHGGKTLVIARFVPVVRSFAPLVAGAGRMDFGRFQLFNITGALFWVVSLVGGGYLFGNLPIIKDNLSMVLVVGIAAALGPVLLGATIRLLRRRRAA